MNQTDTQAWAIMIVGAVLSAICVGGFSAIGIFLWWMHGKIVWLIEEMIEASTKIEQLRKDVDNIIAEKLSRHERTCQNHVITKHHSSEKEEETTTT